MQVLIRLDQACEHWAPSSGMKTHYILEYYIVPDIYLLIQYKISIITYIFIKLADKHAGAKVVMPFLSLCIVLLL